MAIFCKSCFFNLAKLPAGSCPECGQSFDPAQPKTYAPHPKLFRQYSLLRLFKFTAFALVAAAAVLILAALIHNALIPTKVKTDADFTRRWTPTPDHDRWRLMHWLLNDRPRPHHWWPINQTRLDGLTLQEIDALMGPGRRIYGSPQAATSQPIVIQFDIGDIGYWPLAFDNRSDELYIAFDPHTLRVAGIWTST